MKIKLPERQYAERELINLLLHVDSLCKLDGKGESSASDLKPLITFLEKVQRRERGSREEGGGVESCSNIFLSAQGQEGLC
jgi:hypothetical protein